MTTKSFADYLKAKGKWEKEFANVNYTTGESNAFVISVELTKTGYILTDNGNKTYYPAHACIDEELQQYLYDKDKTEIRFCEECGIPYDKGFIAGDGDWYCCEDCFETAMNSYYGIGKWRPSEEEGYYGGWYEYLNDHEKWEDTSIYYTEWND